MWNAFHIVKTKFVFTMLTRKIRLLRRISKAVEAVCKWNGMIFTIMEFRSFNNRRLKMRKKIVNSLINLDLGPMCAGAFLFSFPVMILSMFAQRYIVQGMTAGAVKG